MNTSPPLPLTMEATAPKILSGATSDRLPWLDGLRGIAALGVVLHHIWAISSHDYLANPGLNETWLIKILLTLGRWGSLGVPCFFVLSGFCVGQTWLRAKSPRPFAVRRWLRIFPPYYASLAFVLLCVAAVRLVTGVNDIVSLPAATLSNLFATLTLMTAPASRTPTLSWVYWTLSYEVIFYFVLTLALLVPARARLAFLGVLHAVICALGAWPGLTLTSGLLFFTNLWPLFGLGLALALARQSRTAACWIGVVSLVTLVPLQLSGRYPGFVTSALIATGLVALCAAGFALPRWRPLERLGEFSYSLYLIHVPLLLTLGKYCVVLSHPTPARVFLGTITAVALMVVFAYGFYCLCERPFISNRRSPGSPLTA